MKITLETIKSLYAKLIKRLKTTNYKNPIFWVKFSAYAIPAVFLIYVLYMNFLPFGYQKTFTINVGGPDDTKVGEFYLEPSKDLSERKTAPDGTTYRELNGSATAVFKPKAVLKNANITISVEGDGVSIIPPVVDFKPDEVKWDYAWDFTKEIPKDLKGNAFMFDGEATFNGKDTRLELPSSADKFEDGPFSVYAEWTPKDDTNNMQQIVGHYNWELWQNKDNVEFRVGRMNNAEGPTYSIKYPVAKDFFNTKHSALAIYNSGENGYMELFIDNRFVKIISFESNKIWKDYGDQNISLGWTDHNNKKSPYFSGTIHNISVTNQNVLTSIVVLKFKKTIDGSIPIFVNSSSTSYFKKITIDATQK